MSIRQGLASLFEIDLSTQAVIPVRDLYKHVPLRRAGKRLHCSTGYRWAKGARASDGSIVSLPTIRVGGTLCTSVEALQWFCRRLTVGSAVVVPASTPAARLREQARIDRKLDAAGV